MKFFRDTFFFHVSARRSLITADDGQLAKESPCCLMTDSAPGRLRPFSRFAAPPPLRCAPPYVTTSRGRATRRRAASVRPRARFAHARKPSLPPLFLAVRMRFWRTLPSAPISLQKSVITCASAGRGGGGEGSGGGPSRAEWRGEGGRAGFRRVRTRRARVSRARRELARAGGSFVIRAETRRSRW